MLKWKTPSLVVFSACLISPISMVKIFTLLLLAILQEQDSDGSVPDEEHTTDDYDDERGTSNDNSRPLHISYKTTQELPLMSAFTDPDYFTAAFPTLFPFGIGGHLGDVNGQRPEEVSLKAFAKYTMRHDSLL
jgi:hypothetical protein